jgi:MYXO-CTERM domain-containing protein
MRVQHTLVWAIGFFVAGTPLLATAQTQIKPRVLLMLDTSTSMLEDFNGNNEGADGSSSYADNLMSRNNMYPGPTVAGTCPPSAPFLGTRSKTFAGKAAITNVINGSGDISWGLERYSGTQCAVVDTTTPVNGFFNGNTDGCNRRQDCRTGFGGQCQNNHCTCGGAGDCFSNICDGDGNCGCASGADCTSGVCAAGVCGCGTDNDCPSGTFCDTTGTHTCFIDNNLCDGNYTDTDQRSPTHTCANRAAQPIDYGGDCGTNTGATGSALCATIQTCNSDADCGPTGPIASPGGSLFATGGQCQVLGNGPTKVCVCNNSNDCPKTGGTNMFTCQNYPAPTPTPMPAPGKVCTYHNQCVEGGTGSSTAITGGGGVILIDPRTATSTAVLPWVDNVEDLRAATLNPELRANGFTPLAGAARTATVWYNDIKGNVRDPQILCRPYVLVQITDGADTCENGITSNEDNYGPVAAAAGFVNATIDGANVSNKVYVIGLAVGGLQNELDAMARAGGTGKARLANSQADVESALADIVASSVLFEKCNYIDDDCNSIIDDPYTDVNASTQCNNGAVGHCGYSGKFKCSTDQLSEACGPATCRHGRGISLTKVGSTMTLSGVSGFVNAAFPAGDVGASITIVSSRQPGNRGTFPITAVGGGGTTVSFTNGTGVVENIPSTQIGYELYCASQVICRQGSGTSINFAAGSATLNGVTGFTTAADKGHSLTLNGASVPFNNGTFVIVSATANSVTFTNPNGGNENDVVGFSYNCNDPSCRFGSSANFNNKTANTIDLINVSGFSGADVNSTLTIAAANQAANVGNFVIQAVNAAGTVVTLKNSNGATENVNAVSWSVYCANAETLGGCNNFDDDCDGVVDDCEQGVAGSCCSLTCNGVEVCNGLDDDCKNGIDDNPLDAGGVCNAGTGNGVGDCLPGVIQCCTGDPTAGGTCPGHQAGDGLFCVGGNPGYPKASDLCDGTDDDCDGIPNNVLPQACYIDPTATSSPFNPAFAGVGQCRAGTQTCQTVALPTPAPATQFPCPTPFPVGQTCGACPGNNPSPWPAFKPCPNPVPSFSACVGAVGPHQEVCNTLDDDCDGTPDDNVTDSWVGMPCCPTGNLADCTNTDGGTGIGTTCQMGHYQCVAGGQQCVGGVTKSPETCDGVDNDCNGKVDDVPGLGSTCTANGVLNGGACHAAFICVVGSPGMCDGVPCPNGLTCDQQGTPGVEVCNGIDDDCDGIVDNPTEVAMNDPALMMPCDVPVAPADKPPCMAGTPVCLNGKVECQNAVTPTPNVCGQAATDCTGMQAQNCPPGSMCFQGNCVTPCANNEFPCPGGFVCDFTQDPPLCLPDACAKMNCPSGQNCVVASNGTASCVDPCANVDCGSGFRCQGGACVDDTCRTFGCPDGQVCVGQPAMCADDPCSGITCDSSEYCSSGTCYPLCPTCMKGESCQNGMCQPDVCAGMKCLAGKVCASVNGVGTCVDNMCAGTTCGAEQVCCGGACVNDPCQLVHCPDGITCEIDDQCIASCSSAPKAPPDKIVGAGGGGFACDVGGGARGATHEVDGALWLMALAGLLWWRRRRHAAEVR